MAELTDDLRGDGPCMDCGTVYNIVWFTDSVFWNEVMPLEGIVCIPCFIVRVDAKGFAPTGWRLTPDWHWETRAERDLRNLSGLFADPHPECKAEFHGADGGACPDCGWDPYPIVEMVDHGPVKPPYGSPERASYDEEHGGTDADA